MSVDPVDIEARISKTGQQPPEGPRVTVKDFKGKADPDWCPGCGDFGVLTALKQALVELNLHPHQVMTISGIGCSSNLPGYVSTYGMHTLHGRALAVATGAQLANHDLKIIVTGGDGDGYPTSTKGMKTKSTPIGSVENPIFPVSLAIAAGATYVARGYTGQVKHLVDLIKGGIQHKGFALIDAFSPCVTFNLDNTHEFFKHRTKKLEDMRHDPTNFAAAIQKSYEWGDEIPIGLFWKREDLPSLDQLEPILDEGGPLARRPLGISPETAKSLVRELM